VNIMKVPIWDNQTSYIGVPYGEVVEPISHPPEFHELDPAMRARDEMIYQALTDILGSGPVRIKLVDIPVVERRSALSLAYFKYIKADTHRRNVIATPTHLHENLIDQHYVQGEIVIPESSRKMFSIRKYRPLLYSLFFGIPLGTFTGLVGSVIGTSIGFLVGLFLNKRERS